MHTSVRAANVAREEIWKQASVLSPISCVLKKNRIHSTTFNDETTFWDVLTDAQLFF